MIAVIGNSLCGVYMCECGLKCRYPLEVLAIFDIVLMDMVSRINPLFEKHIQARIFNLKASTCMRNLNPSGWFCLIKYAIFFLLPLRQCLVCWSEAQMEWSNASSDAWFTRNCRNIQYK